MSGEGRQREIITLQVGGLSNWVGAHQWNLDQANSSFSLDSPTQSFSDALYFGKCDKQSSERAPRLVAFDLRGRQGALFADEYALELESSPLDGVTWAGGVTKYVAEPLARNPYLTSLVSSGENGEASADLDRSADVRSGGDDDFAGEPRSATSFFDDEAWSSYGGSAFAERARALLLGSGEDDEEEDDEKDGGEGGKSEGGGSSSLPSWAAEDPRMPRASSSPANDSTGSAGGGDPASALSQGDNDGAAKEKSVEVLPVPLPLRWSDFIEVHLKPKYLVEVPFWDVRNGPFSSFAAGNLNQASGCVLSVDERDEAMDRLRIVLEECDHAQGWQCTVDAQGGFGGLGAALLAEARDQCRSAPIFASVLLDPPDMPTDAKAPYAPGSAGGDAPAGSMQFDSERRRRARAGLDEALTVHALLEHASIVLPLRFGERGGASSAQFNEVTAPIASTAAVGGKGGSIGGGGALGPPSRGGGGSRGDAPEQQGGGEDSRVLLRESARLACSLDTATLPYRRAATHQARPLLMGDWASILSPRNDLRVVAAEAAFIRNGAAHHPVAAASGGAGPELSLLPVPPAILSQTPPQRGRWSCLMSGRGVVADLWPGHQQRAARFSFTDPVVLPPSFPASDDLCHGCASYEANRTPPNSGGQLDNDSKCMSTLVRLGCSDSLHLYLSKISLPLQSIRQQATSGKMATEAARRAGEIDSEDLEAIAEDLDSLAETYCSD